MNSAEDLDTIDWKILRELQREGRITNVELASRVGLSPPPTLRRVQALEAAGFVSGYRAQLNAEKLGYGVKLVALVKRKWGMPLDEFRRHSLEVHAPLDLKLPGLRRYVQCHARDGLYGIGEPPFDAVSCLWFDSPEAVQAALATPENAASAADLPKFLEMKYAHVFLMKEHWSIGPNGFD